MNKYLTTDYHLLKRKNKDGKVVYYVGFLSDMIDKNGRRKYSSVKSTKAGNKALAHKRAREMLADGRVLASRDNLREFLLSFWNPKSSEYLRSKESEEGRTYSGMYLDRNIKNIKKYFLPYMEKRGITRLCDLTPKNLTEWRNYVTHDIPYKDGAGISPRMVNATRQAVFTALNWAVDMDMIPYHPGARVRPVKEGKSEKKIFELKELEKLFSMQWDDIRIYTACMLAASTGVRLGEVRGLLFRNLHLDKGYLDVVTSWQDLDGLKPPKWGSERIGVPIPSKVIQSFHAMNECNRWGIKPDNFVFFDFDTKDLPITIGTIRGGLERALKRAKLKHRTFHSFRHTFISHASGRLSPASLRYHVGHSNEKTTELYQHVTDGDRKALADMQNDIF